MIENVRFEGGCRFANHQLIFKTIKDFRFASACLVGSGYSVRQPEKIGNEWHTVARGKDNPSLMVSVAEAYNASYEGLDYEEFGRWVPIMEFWEKTESEPWLG